MRNNLCILQSPKYGAFFVFIIPMSELEQHIMQQPEHYPPHVQWCFTSRGSIYAAESFGTGRYVVGGSTWDRRHTPFTHNARNTAGLLSEVIQVGDEFTEISQAVFPSMVNTIVPLRDYLFVGCKRGERSFNLLHADFKVMKTQSDDVGGGIYNAELYGNTGDLLVTTRNGYLSQVDLTTLLTVRVIQLNNGESRLWSLAVRNRDGAIFVGDYGGRVYCLSNDLKLQYQLYILDYLDYLLPNERRRYDPSVFGITVSPNGQLVTSIRWGQIDWFDIDGSRFKHDKSFTICEEISQIASTANSRDLLVGTRSGKLLYVSVDKDEFQIDQLLHIPPAYQSDNAVWSIVKTPDQGILASFADGQVVKLDYRGLIEEV